jgi:ABC-2 type transport system ATP-binding protein
LSLRSRFKTLSKGNRDVEQILDDVIFLKEGKIITRGHADDIRAEKAMSIDSLFREEFKC